jgi:AraC-like DNA-binding protein
MTRFDNSIDSSRHTRMPPPRRTVSVSVRSVWPVLNYVAARGHEPKALLEAAVVDASAIHDPEARIPHAAAIGLWAAAERLTGDTDLGLHSAEAIRPGAFGALEYAVRTSETLGAGLERLTRYHRVLHDAAEVRLEIRGGEAVLSHRLPLPGGAPRQVAEFVLAAWLLALRRITATDWAPLEVRFPHAEPADVSEHRRLFAAPVRFEHSRSELRLPQSLLALAIPTADPALQQIVEAQVETLIEGLPAGASYAGVVQQLLAQSLSDGRAALDRIAARLHISTRTLHRRLEQEGTSFRHILHDVRRELAERHLQEGRLMIAEIAFLLGYSEASAFHRAFKRWTGHSPQTFRSRTAGHATPG